MGAPAYPSPCCKARSVARRIVSHTVFRVLFCCCNCGSAWVFQLDASEPQRPVLHLVKDVSERG